MESVTPGPHHVGMDLFMNLVAGLAGALLALTGLYSIIAIWSDELP